MLFRCLFYMFTYSYRVNECCVHNVHSQNILMCYVNCILLYIVLLYCVLNIYVIVQLFLIFFDHNMNIWNDMIKSIIDLHVMRQLLASTYSIYFWCHTKCHINRVSQQFVFVSPLVLPRRLSMPDYLNGGSNGNGAWFLLPGQVMWKVGLFLFLWSYVLYRYFINT